MLDRAFSITSGHIGMTLLSMGNGLFQLAYSLIKMHIWGLLLSHFCMLQSFLGMLHQYVCMPRLSMFPGLLGMLNRLSDMPATGPCMRSFISGAYHNHHNTQDECFKDSRSVHRKSPFCDKDSRLPSVIKSLKRVIFNPLKEGFYGSGKGDRFIFFQNLSTQKINLSPFPHLKCYFALV